MWFKNALVYQLTKPLGLTPEEIGEQMLNGAFKPCGAQDLSSAGFVAPLGERYTSLAHVAEGRIMLCLRTQEKVLPAAAVNKKLNEKVRILEDQEQRKLSRKERSDLKEEIEFEMRPKAFVRDTDLYGYIDGQYLVINATSFKKAENLLTALRECLGSLPVVPLTVKNQPITTMTHWVKEQVPQVFALGDKCRLQDLGDDGKVSLDGMDVRSDEVQAFLTAGMSVDKVQLVYRDDFSFVMDDALAIKSIKFSDMVQEKADDANAESVAEQFDADFTIMGLVFKAFISDLVRELGGVDDSAFELKQEAA